jgi:hypothetical protein
VRETSHRRQDTINYQLCGVLLNALNDIDSHPVSISINKYSEELGLAVRETLLGSAKLWLSARRRINGWWW